jgi:hypothetical protein
VGQRVVKASDEGNAICGYYRRQGMVSTTGKRNTVIEERRKLPKEQLHVKVTCYFSFAP